MTTRNELEETQVVVDDLDLTTTLDASSSSSSSSYQDQEEEEEEEIKAKEGPNYMKTTSSSIAKETTTLQKKSSLTKLSSLKQGRSLIRLSSTRSRRTWIRRSSAGAEFKSKSRSIKPGRLDSAESTTTTTLSLSCNDDRQLSSGSVMNPASSSNQSTTRASTSRPLRRLAKVASLRTRRRPSLNKTSQFRDLHAEKATCSSALKKSKFSDHLELEPGGGTPPQGVASAKVCPYSYCSLHGHHHASPSPPVKKGRRFVTTRRHQLNATESQSGSFDGLKHSSAKVYTRRKADHQNGSRGSSSVTEETRGKHGETRPGEGNGVGFHQKAVQINSGPNIFEDNASTEVADNPFDDIGSLETDATMEKRSVGDMNPDLATVTEEQLAESKEANEDSAQDIPNATADVITDHLLDATHELPKVKHVRMWNLIYKKMISGLAAEDKSQTSDDKAEETDQQEPVNAFPGISIPKENQIGGRDGEIQDIFLYQNNAIKIVQEAFDKILSEIPDQSSDDKSVDRETISDKEAEDINPFKGTRLSISNFSGSLKDNIENHPDEEGSEPKEGRKLEKKEFKSWSNVKKILMLNRFVKALEKVKNINPRKPNILPVQPHSAAEKVNLRHLTMRGRKQSEEWMLDYALQNVIFTLAPAQKRKVAMLVQAFQTIIPDINTPSSDIISSLTTSVDSFPNSPDQSTSEKEKEAHFGAHLRKTEIGDDISKQEEKPIYSCAAEDHIPYTCSGIQETKSRSCFSMEKGSSMHKMVSRDPKSLNNHETEANQQTSIPEVADTRSIDKPSSEVTYALRDQEVGVSLLHVPKEVCPEPAVEAPELDSESNNQKLEGDNQIETFEHGNVVPSVEPVEKSYEAEAQLKGKFVQLFSSLDESQPNPARSVPLENQLNTRLWYLIYKHMASGSTTTLEGEDRKRGNDSTNHLGQQGSSEMNNIATTDHEETDDPEQIEAIRLVEEAIDDIPFPETQEDLRDDPPVSPKKDLTTTENLGKVGNISTLIKTNNSQEGSATEAEKMNIDKEVKREPSIGNKPKRWSNVKKLILLQRFMKSMEKVKKINPGPPQFIPLDPTKVAEKVNLRHQDIGDRKSSDEWMLDHTLQRVVSKLTPARKRKVQLLVEAFETVIPPNWTK